LYDSAFDSETFAYPRELSDNFALLLLCRIRVVWFFRECYYSLLLLLSSSRRHFQFRFNL
jgi:hypothetical protein